MDLTTAKQLEDALLFQQPIPVTWAVQQYRFLYSIMDNLQDKIAQKNKLIESLQKELNTYKQDVTKLPNWKITHEKSE